MIVTSKVKLAKLKMTRTCHYIYPFKIAT